MIGRGDIAPLIGLLALVVSSTIVGAQGASVSSSAALDAPAASPAPGVTPRPTSAARAEPSTTPTAEAPSPEAAPPAEAVPTPAAPAPAPAAPAPAAPAPAPAAPPPPPVCASDVLTCVNAIRAYNGLGALGANATLNTASQACAQRIHDAGGLTHSAATPGFGYWGENIAQGYGSPAAVFNGWMASAGHKANILNANYTTMGLGYVSDGNWWCQQFGS